MMPPSMRYRMSDADRIEHERVRAYWASPEGRAHAARLDALEPYDPNPHGERPGGYPTPEAWLKSPR